MIRTTDVDLRKLNSATKYPSIPTYHALGEKGSLLEEIVDLGGGELIVTEKVDGTNSRIILMPDGRYLIGSREELLHAQGDLIHNPALGIVETLKATADRVGGVIPAQEETVVTVYLETYGGKTTAAAKQYTSRREFGYRVFDVSQVSVSQLDRELESISSWREHGGQDFLEEPALQEFTTNVELELTPRLTAGPVPASIEETHEWLSATISETLVALDADAGGRPEGVVVRTPDRSRIAKIRFEDYERHAKRQAKAQSRK